MHDDRARRVALPRRGLLKALALAPAALAGCAAARAERAPAGEGDAGPSAPVEPPAKAGTQRGPLAAIRSVALAPDAEPACVFRAAAARGGAR